MSEKSKYEKAYNRVSIGLIGAICLIYVIGAIHHVVTHPVVGDDFILTPKGGVIFVTMLLVPHFVALFELRYDIRYFVFWEQRVYQTVLNVIGLGGVLFLRGSLLAGGIEGLTSKWNWWLLLFFLAKRALIWIINAVREDEKEELKASGE